VHAEFAGAGAKQVSAHADVVAEVEQFVELETLLTNRIFLHVNLQLLPTLLQMREPGLAHEANRHDAPGDAHVHAHLFELFRGLRQIVGQNLRDGVRELVLAAVRGLAQGLNPFQFLAPQFVNFVVECQECPLF
jgi:hypothetical protein